MAIPKSAKSPYVIVLGIAQDAGFPQANCAKSCCTDAWANRSLHKMVSSVGIVDPVSNACWLIDATPDFKAQLNILKHHGNRNYDLKGIFLTHAHIGHYTGLIHLGREVMGANLFPVYAMPRMIQFLSENGPWSQLVGIENIQLFPLKNDTEVKLTSNISVKPIKVPHRDEFSETVGFEIKGVNNKLLFIPDIDKWEKWERNLVDELYNHDQLLIDGSFYANGEIPNRDMSEIPHPFVEETIAIIDSLPLKERSKINFIHLNHTNPLLDPGSSEYVNLVDKGYHVCKEFQIFSL